MLTKKIHGGGRLKASGYVKGRYIDRQKTRLQIANSKRLLNKAFTPHVFYVICFNSPCQYTYTTA